MCRAWPGKNWNEFFLLERPVESVSQLLDGDHAGEGTEHLVLLGEALSFARIELLFPELHACCHFEELLALLGPLLGFS